MAVHLVAGYAQGGFIQLGAAHLPADEEGHLARLLPQQVGHVLPALQKIHHTPGAAVLQLGVEQQVHLAGQQHLGAHGVPGHL